MSEFTEETENIENIINISANLSSDNLKCMLFRDTPDSKSKITSASPLPLFERQSPEIRASPRVVISINNDLPPSESDEERRKREEAESEALAWEMMRQDNMEIYQLQMQFMQENGDQLSADDFTALQQIINENGNAAINSNGNQEEDDEDNDDSEGSDNDEEEDDHDAWDYERLLALGQAIGDVKTERWRLRAKNVIKSLPVRLFSQIEQDDNNTSVSSITTAASTTNTEKQITATNNVSFSPNKKICIEANDNEVTKEDNVINKIQCCNGITHHKSNTNNSTNNNKSYDNTRVRDYRCAVCMETFESSDKLNILPCQHYFHIACTEGWLADHNSCPICKKKVTASP